LFDHILLHITALPQKKLNQHATAFIYNQDQQPASQLLEEVTKHKRKQSFPSWKEGNHKNSQQEPQDLHQPHLQ
jgi:hypothetical protein